MDEERPLAATQILPFVIAICRNQATPPLDGVLERRLLANRFRTRVDQERKFTGFFHPGGNQSPPHKPEMTATILKNNNRHGLRRCNIIPRREIRLLVIAKNLPQCLRW